MSALSPGRSIWSPPPSPSGAEGEEGLRIVVSPVQLAAMLQGESIGEQETASGRMWNRGFATIQIVCGAVELVGAGFALAAPEPTGLTKVGGYLLGANGLDNAGTGFVTLWTGNQHTTITAQAANGALRLLGANANTADTTSLIIDMMVPMVASDGLSALRAFKVEKGVIDLAAEEAAGGHTILKHVGKSEAFLR